MSKGQDRYVPTGRNSQQGDELSYQIETNLTGKPFDGPFRAVRDGTHMSPPDRVGYALNLIDWDRFGSQISRSKKQLMRYASGATDIPLGVLSEIATFSGLPVDWLASGRPSTEQERFAWQSGSQPSEVERPGGEVVSIDGRSRRRQIDEEVDVEALELVIETVEKLLQEENIQLTNRKKAEAVAEFYSRLVAERRGNAATLDIKGMQRLLRLLA